MKNLDLMFNAGIENYKSPFYQERKMEHESMEIIILFKKGWEACVKNNSEFHMIQTELNIQEILLDIYNARNLHFDREKLKIRFEIDFEQIEI